MLPRPVSCANFCKIECFPSRLLENSLIQLVHIPGMSWRSSAEDKDSANDSGPSADGVLPPRLKFGAARIWVVLSKQLEEGRVDLVCQIAGLETPALLVESTARTLLYRFS